MHVVGLIQIMLQLLRIQFIHLLYGQPVKKVQHVVKLKLTSKLTQVNGPIF